MRQEFICDLMANPHNLFDSVRKTGITSTQRIILNPNPSVNLLNSIQQHSPNISGGKATHIGGL